MADPCNGMLEQVARAFAGFNLTEAQRVEHGDRPRADSEDVAQNSADAGRCALEWLNRARVVVRLDLKGADQAVANVYSAGVLARPHNYRWPFGWQRHEQLLRMLIGAVLAPQQRVHRQLNLVRWAALLLADELVLSLGQAERDCVLQLRQLLRHARPLPRSALIQRSAGRRLNR